MTTKLSVNPRASKHTGTGAASDSASALPLLLQASDRLNVLDHLHDTVVIVNAQQRIIHANASVERVFGYQPSELVGVEVATLVPERYREHHRQLADTFADDGSASRLMQGALRVAGSHKDGSDIPLQISLSSLEGEPGDLVVAVIRDLSEVHHAEQARAMSEQRYQLLFEQALEGILETDQNFLVTEANPSLRRMFSIPADHDLSSVDLAACVVDRSSMQFISLQLRGGEVVHQHQMLLRRFDGSAFWGSVTAQSIISHESQLAYRLRVVDVTERVEAELEHRRSEARVAAILHGALDAIVVTSGDGTVLYSSLSAESMLGHLMHDGRLTGNRVAEAVTDADVGPATQLVRVLRGDTGGSFETELSIFDRHHQPITLRIGVRDLIGDEEVGGWVWQARDLTAQRKVEAELAYVSEHDQLTGLANRAGLERRLNEAVSRLHRTGVPVALLFIDLDRFTSFNDALGYNAGSNVLCAIGSRLQSSLRFVDCIARLGADEFVAVVRLEEHVDSRLWADEVARVTTIAKTVLHEVRAPIEVGGESVRVSASVGIALATSREVDSAELLRDAEAASRTAKTAGGDCHFFFDPDSRRRADELHRMERELHHAIAHDGLELLYQPIVELSSGLVLGMEALLRLRDSAGRLVCPDEFLGLAEEIGVMTTINKWVVSEAVSALARVQRHTGSDPAPYVSLNTTSQQLTSGQIVEQVMEALAATGADPRGLVVEVTEHGLIREINACRAALCALSELGVRVALDDFGTGYSSLSYLHQLPIDIVKIDRAFVAAIDDEDGGVEMVNAIVAIAKSLRMTTVAEGVETPAQIDALMRSGCDVGQGWGLAMPAPLETHGFDR
ncbi:MAG: EAL domain-containing protein [Actinomycetota bacterium]|nr:EAL domain-containing protein [Actinomycetota bacterium]